MGVVTITFRDAPSPMSTREISTASTTEAKDLPSLPLAEMPLPRGLALPVPSLKVVITKTAPGASSNASAGRMAAAGLSSRIAGMKLSLTPERSGSFRAAMVPTGEDATEAVLFCLEKSSLSRAPVACSSSSRTAACRF